MTDRVPINILGNGAIKQNVYDADGNLLRTEYVKRDDGATVTGTPLNKANILTDAIKALLWPAGSVPDDPSVADVFGRLSGGMLYDGGTPAITDLLGNLITLPVAQLDNPVKIAVGTYTGTGTYGSTHKSSLTLPFASKVLFIIGPAGYGYFSVIIPANGNWWRNDNTSNISTSDVCSITDNTVYWHNTSSASLQQNSSGKVYQYVAIGV
jgi:hypothetical protein